MVETRLPNPLVTENNGGIKSDIAYQRLAERIIISAYEDRTGKAPGTPSYESATYFFATDCLDCWCIFFRGGTAQRIRKGVLGFEDPIEA